MKTETVMDERRCPSALRMFAEFFSSQSSASDAPNNDLENAPDKSDSTLNEGGVT